MTFSHECIWHCAKFEVLGQVPGGPFKIMTCSYSLEVLVSEH